MLTDISYEKALERGFNGARYDEWRKNRIEKIINIFGKDFFKDKKVLELGCGVGHIGNEIEDLGAFVTFTEGNKLNFNNIVPKNNKSKKILLDQDKPWSLKEKFDVVIHWGVLYHLDNWKQDLLCAMEHTDLIFLETSVYPFIDKDEIKIDESPKNKRLIDQALNGIGTIPSVKSIENFISNNGFSFERYDDSDLTTPKSKYDWKSITRAQYELENKNVIRRFWILKRNT